MAIYGSEMAGGMEFHIILLFDVIPGTLFCMFSSLDPKNNCQQKNMERDLRFGGVDFLLSHWGTETFAHWDIDIGKGNT